MRYYLDTDCLYYRTSSELNSGFFTCKISLKRCMNSCFLDKTYKNKIGWGNAWGVCYCDRYHVSQHTAELAVCQFVYNMLVTAVTMNLG